MEKSTNKDLIKELKGKVGTTIIRSLTTGNDFFTEVYKRKYTFEIRQVKYSSISINVKTDDICPTGYIINKKSKNYFDININKVNFDTMNDLLFEIICRINFNFILKYKLEENMLQ